MEEEKIRVSPDHTTYTDDDHSVFTIEVEIPGASKDDIHFKMSDESFYVSASANDKRYVMNHATCHPVVPEEAKASYKNGLLKVDVPFKDSYDKAVDVKIE
jgi:HSP20 family molecular chaperone IbpA